MLSPGAEDSNSNSFAVFTLLKKYSSTYSLVIVPLVFYENQLISVTFEVYRF